MTTATALSFLIDVFLLLAALAVLYRLKLARQEASYWRDCGKVLQAEAEKMVEPLSWLTQVEASTPKGQRLQKVATSNAFRTLQAIMGFEDDEMADLIDRAAEPPRVLPRYPQLVPYLATPEDVLRVETSPVRQVIAERLEEKLGPPAGATMGVQATDEEKEAAMAALDDEARQGTVVFERTETGTLIAIPVQVKNIESEPKHPIESFEVRDDLSGR